MNFVDWVNDWAFSYTHLTGAAFGVFLVQCMQESWRWYRRPR